MSKNMRIDYIAHQIAGDIEANLASIRAIIREINMSEPDTVPFCPYYADVVSLDDNDPAQRARGIKNGIALIKSGIVNNVRLFGPRISSGMAEEIDAAQLMGVPIICSTNDLYEQLKPLLLQTYI